MKVDLENGELRILPENINDAYALKAWAHNHSFPPCGFTVNCGGGWRFRYEPPQNDNPSPAVE